MDQRAAQPEFLLHPARELGGRAVGKFSEPRGSEQHGHARGSLGAMQTKELTKSIDVFRDRERRVKIAPQPLRHIGNAGLNLFAKMRLIE